MEVKNKIAIVTGASSGIGLATATLLTKNGAKVALIARSKDKLTQLSQKLAGSFARPTDMTDEDDIKKMVQDVKDHYGRIDILINNAGQGYDSLIENTNIKTLHHIFDLDLVGPLIAMQQVIPIMKLQSEGSIINISSGTALMHLPNMGVYAAIKASLAHLSLTAREELKGLNISVSVVYPYITLTDFEENTITEAASKNETEYSVGYEPPAPDTAELIAHKILNGIKSKESEIFAHEWMKKT